MASQRGIHRMDPHSFCAVVKVLLEELRNAEASDGPSVSQAGANARQQRDAIRSRILEVVNDYKATFPLRAEERPETRPSVDEQRDFSDVGPGWG